MAAISLPIYNLLQKSLTLFPDEDYFNVLTEEEKRRYFLPTHARRKVIHAVVETTRRHGRGRVFSLNFSPPNTHLKVTI